MLSRSWRGSRPIALLAIGATAAWLSASGNPAPAQETSLADQQEQVRQREVDIASQVDALRADADEVDAAITTLERNVGVQRARVDNARAALAAAHADLAAARKAGRDAEAQASTLRDELRDVVLDAYVRPPSEDLAVALGDEDPTASIKRKALAEARTRSSTDVLDQLQAAEQRAARAGARAAEAVARAQAAADAEQHSLDELASAHAEQQALADDVHARLDAALSEAVAISGRSQELADQITAREQQLAARVSVPSSSSRPSWVSSGVTVTTVRGIEVNVSIAGQLEALLAAAWADGVELTGSGFRDISTQIALREQHCGSSEYAIWEMSSGECSPPVARPGYSMHEQGLAVDFLIGDDLIRSRATAAFVWLSDHAADYGFHNLPSEPWHWSTTGT